MTETISPDKLRILILSLGGTIAMHSEPGQAADVSDCAASNVADRVLELARIALKSTDLTLKHVKIANKDSTDLDTGEWELVVSEIESRQDEFDCVLITTGTNTLAYLSSAISFALSGCPMPIVVTGAQVPMESPWTDAELNLVNSFRWLGFAVMELVRGEKPFRGVFVVFGGSVILGCRAKKVTEAGYEAFESFNNDVIAEFGPRITVFRSPPVVSQQTLARFQPCNGFNPNIACITLIPGLSARHLISLIRGAGPQASPDIAGDPVRGIVLRSYGSGDIPENLFPFLDAAEELGVPVVNTTQCPKGKTMMGVNTRGEQALKDYRVIPAHDTSMEAMSTKLMWLLNKHKALDKHLALKVIREEMLINIAGEIDPRIVRQQTHVIDSPVHRLYLTSNT
jgi:L-asparaginase